jgi:glycosyltransferase involved in cell wall biosynthesis
MSSATPLVSVCVPLYNTERFLGEALEGITRQTHQALEIIVCDNASTDSSWSIAETFARRDSRVRLVKNKRNLGYAGNLHKVTSLARGDFMMVHCADDLAAPEGIERLVKLATRPGVNARRFMGISDAYITDDKGHPFAVGVQAEDGYENASVELDRYQATGTVRQFKGRVALSHALARIEIVGFMGATLYSRSLFESIEGVYNGLLYSPDAQLNYYLLNEDPDVLWLREPLFSWRLHETNQISQARGQAIPKQALDCYSLTFHFPQSFLDELGLKREEVVDSYLEKYCFRKALSEIRSGSRILAFRHLCLALATYPRAALRSPKFYVGIAGVTAGPLGRWLAQAGYRMGVWRRTSPARGGA